MSGWGWIATSAGLGLAPGFRGILGVLVGVVLVLLIRRWSVPRQALAMTVLIIVAIPICDAAELEFGEKDDGRIILDEAVGFPVATLGIGTAGHPVLMVTAVAAFAVLDSTKPFPVDRIEAIPGGTGIVLDDVAAALLALIVTTLAQVFYRRLATDPDPE